MSTTPHQYRARLVWEGNTGSGTSSYSAYERRYRVQVAGKPDLIGTSDPHFRGEADKHNPEDLFLAAISACHMLFYLSLAARNGIRVVAYEDTPQGIMTLRTDGGGYFEAVTLHPTVTIAAGSDEARAAQLHERAHQLCFIANSCNFPIHHQAVIQSEEA